MNRTRCPWCGKIVDKKKDTVSWRDVVVSPSVPRMLRQANCGHCRNKYGQVPVSIFFSVFTPYSKLDERGKLRETNTDLLCEFVIIETYDKIKCDELYFLDDCFDEFEPFFLASPIQVHRVSKKDDTVTGEFLYMHEKNYNYIKKDSCELYNTNMELVAKIKFVTNEYTIS